MESMYRLERRKFMISIKDFIKDLDSNMLSMTRSDIQACIEARCMQTGEKEEELLKILDNRRR